MQKRIAFLVIGDEILNGRTQDVNVQSLALALSKIGASLDEVRMIRDNEAEIIDTVLALSKNYDYVFTSGGIGPTHDDITAEAIAKAFHVNLSINSEARAMLASNYENGEADLTPARLRMARIPEGAELIINPISKAPGFFIKNVFTLAGVPKIFSAMLNHALGFIEHGQVKHSRSLVIHKPESQIADPLTHIAQKYTTLSIGSYPNEKDGQYFAEIVISGFNEDDIHSALIEIQDI